MAKRERVETADKVRVQLDVTSAQLTAMDQLMTYCDLYKRKELFDVSMSLFAWAVEEARKGNRIASYNREADHVETIIFPALEAARSHAAARKVLPDNSSAGVDPHAESMERKASRRTNLRSLQRAEGLKPAVAN